MERFPSSFDKCSFIVNGHSSRLEGAEWVWVRMGSRLAADGHLASGRLEEGGWMVTTKACQLTV